MRRLGMLLLLSACGANPDIDGLQTATLAVPPGGRVRSGEVIVPQRRVVAFVVQPMAGDETSKEDITLEPLDSALAEVLPVTEKNHFAVIGRQVGTTTLLVLDEAGNETSASLDLRVVDETGGTP